MRRLGKLNKPLRIALSVVFVLAFIFLSAFWGVSAYLSTHSVLFYGYDGYRTTYKVAEGGDYTYSHFVSVLSNGNVSGIRVKVRCTHDGVWVCSSTDAPFRDAAVLISASDYSSVASSQLRGTDECIVKFYDLAVLCSRQHKTLFVEPDFASEEHLATLIEDATDIVGYYRLFFGAESRDILEKVTKKDRFARCYLFANSASEAFFLRGTGYAAFLSGSALKGSVIEKSHEKDLPVFAVARSRQEYDELSILRVDYVFMENLV